MSPFLLIRVSAHSGLAHCLCVAALLWLGVAAPVAFAQGADELAPPPPPSGSPAPGTPPGTPAANPAPPVSPPPGVVPAPSAPGVASDAPAPTGPDDEFADEFDAPSADAPSADAPAADGADAGEASDTGDATEATDARLRVLVIDAAPYGVDPVVGEHVSAQLRLTATQLGYAVATRDESVAAARSASMPFPPSPADL